MSSKSKSKASARKRILIVDDHPMMREGLRQLVGQQPDLEVCCEAENAAMALQIAEKGRPDLAIVDISLKESSGLELIKDLRIRHPGLPVLVLSMHDESLYAERVLREAAPAKAAQARLEAEFKKREGELNDTGTKLRADMDKLDKEGPTLSEAERTRRQRDLSEQQRDFERKRRELMEDLNTRKNEELAAVTERASKVIKQIFEQEKYDLILQEVVFAGPRVDITKKVIDALNAGK